MPVYGLNEKNQRMGAGYHKDPISTFAARFKDVAENMLQESGVDIFTDANTALLRKDTLNALREFFVEESADPTGMAVDEYEDHIQMMNEQFTNDRDAILEHAGAGSFNPVIGMTFPMHKNFLMQNVFENGGIPKAVAATPKFTMTMEYRIFVDSEGNEIDMFREQQKIKEGMDKVNPFKKVELDTPGVVVNVIEEAYPEYKKGIEHLSIDPYVSAVTVTKGSDSGVKLATNVQFTPGYNDYDRIAVQSFTFTPETDESVTEESIQVSISVFMKDDTFMYLAQGVDGATVDSIELAVKLDTSSATLPTCSVKWREKTDIVEIPTATPINVTISPEEIKDIQKLYNVNQLSKVMSLIKDAMGNHKDDCIKEELDRSFATMPADQKISGTFDFAPRDGYAHDHVTWRHLTFMDALDSYVTDMLEILNDPNMTVTIYGRPDIIRKITPTTYDYKAPETIGAVDLEYTKVVTSSDKRVYQFISSQKIGRYSQNEADKNSLIIILKPRNSERIIYRIYDYQFYVSNDIRNAANPALPAVHAFDRWKFVAYQPVQGRIRIMNPTGLKA